MHVADALVSPPVAIVGAVSAIALLTVAVHKLRKNPNEAVVPLMGVMGAFVFAAQMINFTIPGTGSSGHLVGGILLASLLGPWAAFLTLSSVLIIQCLLFADGGLMALGCNILNMAAVSCLVAYPLFFKPLIYYPSSSGRIVGASLLSCVLSLVIGAFLVVVETVASGISALLFTDFLWFMLPIHFFIGIGEGLATAAVLYFVQRYKPVLLVQKRHNDEIGMVHPATQRLSMGKALTVLVCITVALALSFSFIASSKPDGLEWSMMKTQMLVGQDMQSPANTSVQTAMQELQKTTALLPNYDDPYLSGIVGGIAVVLLTCGVAAAIHLHRHKKRIINKPISHEVKSSDGSL